MKKRMYLPAAAAVFVAGTWFAAASAETAGVKVGVLTCDVDSGWGYVLGSSKDVHCNYMPNVGRPEHYTGTISKLGVDIGHTSNGVIIWDVIAPTSDVERGALAGGYGGVTAGAALGVGVAANALLGGFEKSIALQPLSVEGDEGFDIAAGIGALTLKFDNG